MSSLLLALCFLAAGCASNVENGADAVDANAAGPTIAPRTSAAGRSDTSPILTGAGRLVNEGFELLEGRSVGLISHQNSTVDDVHLADLLHDADNVDLVALFGPEHGARGDRDAGEYVEDTIDPATGVPVFSLFGETRQPLPKMLEGIDVLVYDLQDVGTRYFTYVSTMGLAMQAAAQAGVSFVVLDRPNPLGGDVGGGVLDPEFVSFVGQYPISDTYGLTAGELARAIVSNRWLDDVATLELHVVPMSGWNRSMQWNDTGLEWIAPSPAMTTPDAALLYPITVYLEATSLSYGRGTEEPFQIFGAPWLDAEEIAARLGDLGLEGIRFDPGATTPRLLPGMTVEPAYRDIEIPVVKLTITNAETLDADATAVHVLDQVLQHARQAGVDVLQRPDWLDKLSGSTGLRTELGDGTAVSSIIARRTAEAVALSKELEGYRLYPAN